MKYWIALLFAGLLVFTSCKSDDDDTPAITYDLPLWKDSIEAVSITNTPTVQINRFVAANNMDTVVTASGLVYMILEPGGLEKPSANSEVVAWYRGYTTDGVIFDQTYNSPFAAVLTNLIQGWQEGIPKVGRGGKIWMLVRPSLAYMENSPSNGNTVLVFEIELADFE